MQIWQTMKLEIWFWFEVNRRVYCIPDLKPQFWYFLFKKLCIDAFENYNDNLVNNTSEKGDDKEGLAWATLSIWFSGWLLIF